MYDLLEVYTMTDQPVTCPKCGSRTQAVLTLELKTEKPQFHQCYFESCKYKFIVEEDFDIEIQA